tara:strand:- start:7991 stop:8179 length:189 start_codon:yes stop_codon:yes gene_type:complete
MPFEVVKKSKNKYQLIRVNDKKIVNKIFLSKSSAIASAKNYMNYRGEKNIKVVGNFILNKKG